MLDGALIKDFNYYYFNSGIDKSFLPKRSIYKNIAFFFIKFFRNFISDIKHRRFLISFKDQVIFYSAGLNEYYSLNEIYKNTPLPKLFVNNPPYGKPGVYFPRFLPSLLSLFYLPAFLRYYFFSDKVTRDNINYSRNDVLHSYGYYVFFKNMFKNNRPKAIVVSNDHLCDIRIIIHFCNIYKVPSFYVQHASVSYVFPKLNMDYALLEGEEARKTYITAGSDPRKIYLIGMVKADPWIKKINTRNAIGTIGFAINSTENEALLVQEINSLIAEFPDKKIILRPHPQQYTYQMKERLSAILKNINRTSLFYISDPRTENAFEFILQLDVLISGNSSIHLEAVLLNVLSVFYDNTGVYSDPYGYLKNDLTKKAGSIKEIIQIINLFQSRRPFVRDKAKLYIDTVNTLNEGRSAILAAEIIREKLSSYSSGSTDNLN
jgi:hypothetical protein